MLAWVVKNVRGMRYEEVRRQATPTGFVQQHVVRGTAPNCIVCTVTAGRITHLDEYLDSAHITHLLP